jgi:hypothetical protein
MVMRAGAETFGSVYQRFPVHVANSLVVLVDESALWAKFHLSLPEKIHFVSWGANKKKATLRTLGEYSRLLELHSFH